jgi:hypothetical protein
MSPYFLVAGFVDRLSEEFVGFALFRVVLVEIRVKHPHQLLPKLLQPRRLVLVEFPFPLQRGRRGIVFPILLRRIALVVIGRRSGGFLAFRQQAVDEGFPKLHQQPQSVPFLIGRPQRGEEFGADGIHLRLLDPVFQFQFRQAVPRCLHQPLVKLFLRMLENHQPGGGGCSA